MTAEDKLRAFAQAMLKDWPEGSPDAFDIQDEAVKHGLLVAADPKPTKPCSEEEGGCWCASYFSEDDWRDGVTCYRRSAVLTGTNGVPSDAGIPASGTAGVALPDGSQKA